MKYRISKKWIILILFIVIIVCVITINKSAHPKAPSRVVVAIPQYNKSSFNWLGELVIDFSPKNLEPYSVKKSIPESEYNDYLNSRVGIPDTEDLFYIVNGRQVDIFKSSQKIKSLKDNPKLNSPFKRIVSDEDGYYYQPITWYNWGIYYSEKIIQSVGFEIYPETWDEFLLLCKKLKEKGVDPIVIPKSEMWAGTIWFEYINIRINGGEFHKRLLNLEESWSDPRVVNTFNKLRELKPFIKEIPSKYTWENCAEIINNNESGMILMGRFFSQYWEEHFQNDISWSRFPIIDKEIGKTEIVSSAGFILNSRTLHNKEAEAFLSYLSSDTTSDYIETHSSSLPVANKLWWEGKKGIDKKMWENISVSDTLQPVLDRSCDPKLVFTLKFAVKEVLFTNKPLEQIIAPLNKINTDRN